MTKPVVFCFDGSDGSQRAMAAAASLVVSADAVVLTVWETVSARLARAGSFVSFDASEGEDDQREEQSAVRAADAGAAAARERGYVARSRVEMANGGVAKRIIEVCDELDARLIVCGRRGRGVVRSALLGSVSRDLIGHAGRPMLVAPEAAGSTPAA